MTRPALAEHYEAANATYAQFGNGVVAAHAQRLLPDQGRVLDLGCASGGLLALLRARAGYLAGLELSPTAAETAGRIGDEVVCGALEDPELPFAEASFDVVVLADVLEHLVDSVPALGRAIGWCAPGGSVIVSVPNIAHWQARWTVARGRWPAAESGTFDVGHLRFFTVQRVRSLLNGADLVDVSIEPVVPCLRNHLSLGRLPGRAGGELERGWQAAGRRFPGLLAYQLVGIGRRRDG